MWWITDDDGIEKVKLFTRNGWTKTDTINSFNSRNRKLLNVDELVSTWKLNVLRIISCKLINQCSNEIYEI